MQLLQHEEKNRLIPRSPTSINPASDDDLGPAKTVTATSHSFQPELQRHDNPLCHNPSEFAAKEGE